MNQARIATLSGAGSGDILVQGRLETIRRATKGSVCNGSRLRELGQSAPDDTGIAAGEEQSDAESATGHLVAVTPRPARDQTMQAQSAENSPRGRRDDGRIDLEDPTSYSSITRLTLKG